MNGREEMVDYFSGTDTDSHGSWETLSDYTNDGERARGIAPPEDQDLFELDPNLNMDLYGFQDDGIMVDVAPTDQSHMVRVEEDDDDDDNDDDDEEDEGDYVLAGTDDEAKPNGNADGEGGAEPNGRADGGKGAGDGAKPNGKADGERGAGGEAKPNGNADGEDGAAPRRRYTMADLDPRDFWLLNRDLSSIITGNYGPRESIPVTVSFNFIHYWYDDLNAMTVGYVHPDQDPDDENREARRPSNNSDSPLVTSGRKLREREAKMRAVRMVRKYYHKLGRSHDEAFHLELRRAMQLAAELVHISSVQQTVLAHHVHAMEMSRNPEYARAVELMGLPEEFDGSPLFRKWWFGVNAEYLDVQSIRSNAGRTILMKNTLMKSVQGAWRHRSNVRVRAGRVHHCWITPIRWIENIEPNGGVTTFAMALRPLRNCEIAVGGGVSGGDGTTDGLEEDIVVRRWVAKAVSIAKLHTRNIPPYINEHPDASVGEIMHIAVGLGLSGRGELLSINAMAFLAKLYETGRHRVHLEFGDLKQKMKRRNGELVVVNHLMLGHRILVCYDAGEHGEPVQNEGRNPRWAVLCGVIVEKNRAADVSPAVGPAWVVARTGMRDQYSVWPLDELAASNRQLETPSGWFTEDEAPIGAEAEAARHVDQTYRDAYDLCQVKRCHELACRLAQGDHDFLGLERQCPYAAESWRSAARALRCVWLDDRNDDWLDEQVRSVLTKYGVPAELPVPPVDVPSGPPPPMPSSEYSPLSPPTTPPPSPTPLPSPEDMYGNPCQFGEGLDLQTTLACKYVVLEPIRKINHDPQQQDPMAPAQMIFDFEL